MMNCGSSSWPVGRLPWSTHFVGASMSGSLLCVAPPVPLPAIEIRGDLGGDLGGDRKSEPLPFLGRSGDGGRGDVKAEGELPQGETAVGEGGASTLET
jgi:hypothetical protein